MNKAKWYSKPLYALVALALVLSLGITAVPMAEVVEANPGTYYVAKTGSDGNAGGSGDPWLTIQHALDTVSSSDTIIVGDGTYTEDLKIENKTDITLRSENGRASTTIQTTAKPGIEIQVTATNFKLGGASGQGFTVNGTADHLIVLSNNPSGVEISHNKIDTTGSPTRGVSVGTAGATGLTISDNEFVADSGDGSISAWDGPSVSATVSGNTMSGGAYAIQFSGVTGTSTISGNTISGYTGAGGIVITNGSGTSGLTISGNSISSCSHGIRFEEECLAPHSAGDMTTVTVEENNLINSTSNGIKIGAGTHVKASQFIIRNNNFSSTTTFGLKNENTEAVTAENNWWGDVSGPSGGAGVYGTGDEVSSNVDFTPWLDDTYPEGGPIEWKTTPKEETTVSDPDTVDATSEADTKVIKSGSGTPKVTVGEYSHNPADTFACDIGKYIDVHIDDDTNVTALEIRLYYTAAEIVEIDYNSLKLRWWNGTAWVECSDTGVTHGAVNSYSGYIWAKIRSDTTPTLAQLVGAPFGAASVPMVTTDAATLVEETTATLNGTLTNDGGEACQYRFQWDTDPGEPYAYQSDWSVDTKTTGQSFSADISLLAEGTRYYFRAQCRNSAGTGNGTEETFLTKPDAPANFVATTAGTKEIDLSWTKGDGAGKTMIRRKTGDYPSSREDGEEAYFDTGTSTPDTGLTPDTTYYYRAWSYVTGSEEKWSDNYVQAVASTTAVVQPTVTTNAATSVEETSATLHGTITNDGGEACQYRFEYDTGSGAPYANSTTWTGSKTSGQSFSESIPGLSKGTKYYFRAQAKNFGGTASGSELTFLTKPDAPTCFVAVMASSTEINLSWAKGDGAEKTKIVRKVGSYPSSRTDGTEVYFGTGTSHPDTGLTPGTTYCYSAWSYVEGSEQWSDNCAQDSATTAAGVPTVTTDAATLVEETTATLNGTLTADGGEACQYRFEYGTSPGVYSGDTGWLGSKTSGESFSESISGLSKGTKYYFVAQAKNSAGNATGSELTFLTKPDAPTGFSATPVGTDEIDLSWTKGAGAEKTMIRRSDVGYPSAYDDGTQVYFGTGTSTQDTGLTPSTTYYYRAWSHVEGSVQWSDSYAQDSATTLAIVTPTVTTNAATSVEETTATLNGIIDDDGGEACNYRFQYGTSTGVYDYDTGWTGSKSTGESFSAAISGLSKGTKYYFVAQAKNSAGNATGSELTFLTKPDAPTGFSATAAGEHEIDLSWSMGAGAQKTKIVGKIGSYPSSRTDGTEVYFDTGTSTPDSGLLSGTTYYYSAWSYVAGSEQWSDGCAHASATTEGGVNHAPNTPSAPSPADTATGVSINANLGWVGGDPDAGDTVTYEVYFGTSSPPPYKGTVAACPATQTAIGYDPGTLDYSTMYYWKIVATDNHAASATGPEWDFTTIASGGPHADRVLPSSARVSEEFEVEIDIANAQFGNIIETLPPDFAFVTTDTVDVRCEALLDSMYEGGIRGVITGDREAKFTFFAKSSTASSFKYFVTAPAYDIPGAAFDGVLRLSPTEEYPVGGDIVMAIVTGVVTPTVTTGAATLVEETSATLNGTLTADGGEACQYRFGYGTTSGGSYTYTTWSVDTRTSGQSFSAAISGLAQGTKYYFIAQAKNTAGTASGTELSLLTKPEAPTSFNATAFNATQIDLSWVIGAGAQQTMIRRSEADYPGAHDAGVEVYFGTGTNVADTALSANTTYYYSAWSYVAGSEQWSDSCAQASANTSSEWDPWVYDEDSSGYIEISELLQAIGDYIDSQISISELLELIALYIGHTPKP